MTLGPILHAKLAKYIQDYELAEVKEGDAFELFVNDVKILWRTFSKVANQENIGQPSVDDEVELNQIVSLRHYGRIKLCEIGKITKKDRIVINVEIYQ